MNFKSVLYKNYGSTQNIQYLSNLTLGKIKERFPVYDFFYRRILPNINSSSILDIGCGDGNFVYYLQENGCKDVRGIDLSEEQISIGKNMGIKGLELADLHAYLLNFENCFDYIIARDVMEHLTRQETFDALLKIYRALKPGGTFIMQVPNGEGIHYTSIFFGDFTHEMAYSSKSVNQIFLNVGFKDIRSIPVNPFSGGLKGKIRASLWRLRIMMKRFSKMVEFGTSEGIFTANLIGIGKKPLDL